MHFKELSDTEQEIMDFLWSGEKEGNIYLFSEILTYFNESKSKNWKKQTLSVFFIRLQEKNMVQSKRRGRSFEYTPTLSQEEYEKRKAQEIIDKQYGTMEKFLVAFYHGKAISKEEKRTLTQWLDNLEEV